MKPDVLSTIVVFGDSLYVQSHRKVYSYLTCTVINWSVLSKSMRCVGRHSIMNRSISTIYQPSTMQIRE